MRDESTPRVATSVPSLDVFGPGSHGDPYPHYQSMREAEPVTWIESQRLWLVTRHGDVVDVLRRQDDFSAIANERQEPEVGRRGTPNIITLDRPDHDRLRQILQRRFTNRGLARYQEQIDHLAKTLVTGLREIDEFDLVGGLTVPLPVTLIAHAMGIELERLDDFKRWSDALVRILIVPQGSEAWSLARDELHALISYFKAAADNRREHPNDDLVGLLTEAENEPDRISEREIISYCLLLLAAGNETTTNLLGGLLIELFKRPEQLQLLVDEPEERLPNAIEEGLRYCSPVQVLFRRAKHDCHVGGALIRENEDVGVCYASANRDATVFDNPDEFDITRDNSAHVAFGYGLHHCLGAHLARRETTSAMRRLIPWLTQMVPIYRGVEWVDSWVVRGPKALPMRWVRS